MNRRKFLSYIGCGCCGFILNSCTSAPITERKQLKLVSEAKLNAKAAEIFEKVKKKYINSDKFKVVIKSQFNKRGNLNYGELVIPGKSKQEIMLRQSSQ